MFRVGNRAPRNILPCSKCRQRLRTSRSALDAFIVAEMLGEVDSQSPPIGGSRTPDSDSVAPTSRGLTQLIRTRHDSIRELLRAASAGLPDAQFAVGELCASGDPGDDHGSLADAHEAFAWYHCAASAGHPQAIYALGNCYAQGRGVSSDRRSAVVCWLKAAELGHAGAQCSVGVAFSMGWGVAEVHARAVAWFAPAAAAGHTEALYNLGNCYDTRRGVASVGNPGLRPRTFDGRQRRGTRAQARCTRSRPAACPTSEGPLHFEVDLDSQAVIAGNQISGKWSACKPHLRTDTRRTGAQQS